MSAQNPEVVSALASLVGGNWTGLYHDVVQNRPVTSRRTVQVSFMTVEGGVPLCSYPVSHKSERFFEGQVAIVSLASYFLVVEITRESWVETSFRRSGWEGSVVRRAATSKSE